MQVRDKSSLRTMMLARRDDLEMAARIEAALDLVRHIQAASLDVSGKTVAAYWPIRSEIDPRPLMDHLRTAGARLALPVKPTRGAPLAFRELLRGGELVPQGFGTYGPDDTAALIEPDILLLPLVAFDRNGNRLGYGQGHYDRTLEALQRSTRKMAIGLAYAAQEVAEIPAEPHDKPLDAVLTERGWMNFKG